MFQWCSYLSQIQPLSFNERGPGGAGGLCFLLKTPGFLSPSPRAGREEDFLSSYEI